ncbi:MAG: tRNA(His) guanylyltransferase Thg1 family protein [Myxococcota bacterium]
MKRPYDERLSELMVQTTIHLVEETGACIGYTQSDEISLVLENREGELYLRGRVQKLTSILASMATAFFNLKVQASIPERAERPALFDCRAFVVPSREEAANVLLWRELDATKNSVSMASRHHYGHGELMNKSQSEMQDLLHEVGVNWNDYPSFFKRGTFVQRRKVLRPFSDEERDHLPEKHAARTQPDLVVERTTIAPVEMPPFRRVTNRTAVVFEGSQPVVGP